MNILIAPHPDDEIIGCYSLIKKGLIDLVVHIDASITRLKHAGIAGKNLGFKVGSVPFRDLYTFLEGKDDSICFVPDIADNHILHKAINCIGRLSGCRLGYYTTDMNTGYTKELSKEQQKEKRVVLDRYYFDQSSLWERDWKYFLFEGVVYDVSATAVTLQK